jgi:hypothetical protein
MGSHIFDLHCANCQARVLRYRKEGSGSLVRLFLDRISEPKSISELKRMSSKSDLPPLNCPDCDQPIGIPMTHGTGNRLAYRLIKGSTKKGK